MRPNLNWDGYAAAVHQLNRLVQKETMVIIRMVASNRHGMTEQQIIDNCKLPEAEVRGWIHQLHCEGFFSIKTVVAEDWGGNWFGPKRNYYQCNWGVIKSINKAISRLP